MIKICTLKSFVVFILVSFIFNCVANRKSNTAGDVSEKIATIQKMGEKRQVKSINYLIEELKNSNSDAIRIEAAKALGKIGDESAVSALEEVVAIEKNQNIRKAAKEAITLIKK